MNHRPALWRILISGAIVFMAISLSAANRPENSHPRVTNSPTAGTAVQLLSRPLYLPNDIIFDTVITECGIGLIVGPDGNMGENSRGGANMNFPPFTQGGPECDTGLNSRGDATIYLGDASPIVIRKPAASTYTASWAIYGDGFSDPHGFIPLLGGVTYGGFTGPGYDACNSGTFCTSDSLLKIEKTWYAPTGAAVGDSCTFIVQRMRIFAFSAGTSVTNLAIGEAYDWDVPTDSGSSNNVAGFDVTRRLLYMRGFNSSDAVVDCYDNSLRYAGAALLTKHLRNCASTGTLYAGYNAPNDTFVFPAAGFVPEQLWNKMQISGYTSEPRITDLHSMLVYQNGAPSGWTLPANDTLTIWTVMAVVRPSGGTAAQAFDSLRAEIDKASQWYRNVKTLCQSCCVGTTGDVNIDGRVDISDLSWLIGGIIIPPPLKPELPCLAEANVNGSPSPYPDLSDISLLISYLVNSPRPILPNCPPIF